MPSPKSRGAKPRDTKSRGAKPRNTKPRDIGLLIFPDFQILDAAGPIGAFEMPMRGMSPAPYRLKVMASEPGTVRSSSGVAMIAEAIPRGMIFDTLIIAGGQGTRGAMVDPLVLDLVRRQMSQGRRLCSVCSGAYVLAAAGVLDGKQATTHWRRTPDFKRRYPKVRLEPDRIFTRDGKVWTSAGITAGIDLALALIAEDLGEEAARATAQELVVYHRRPGGQSQFSALLEIERPEGRFSELLGWARERLDQRLSVEALATRANMSPRNFARAFAAEMGVTPAKAIERLRLETARLDVEHAPGSIDAIARASGFGDPERMRRAFLRAFGQPPAALRRLART